MPLPQKKLIPSLLLLLALFALAAPPLWWSGGSDPVINSNPAENKAPANIGQAKHIVSKALSALQTAAPSIAAEVRADLLSSHPDLLIVPNPKTPEWIEKQKAPLLIGQLKAIADPFYRRLNTANPTWLSTERSTNGTNHPNSIFPWTATPDDDANRAIANIGQLKAVFSLRFETLPPPNPDMDGDGMPNAWEIQYGLNPNNPSDANGDIVGDGVSNLVKYKIGRNPLVVALPDTSNTLALRVHTSFE
jgi:hypothetical protein